MIRTRRGLILVASLVFVLGIFVLFPARVAYQWFATPGVSVSNIQGTVWNGRAAEASLNGFYLHDIRWTFQPGAILSAALGFQLEARPVSGFIDTSLYAKSNGAIQLRELSASMPLGVLGSALQVSGLNGSASLQFERIEIDDSTLLAADGTLTVGNLSVPLIARDVLGGYRAEFSTQADGINASLEDTDNIMDLAASLVIRSDRSYDLNGLVVPTNSTPASLRQQMEFLGPPNERGQRQLRFGGTY